MARVKKLKAKALKNTKVEKKSDGKVSTLKSGKPKDLTDTHSIDRTGTHPRTVGVNLGITKNMDNYESLRVDCWLTDELLEGETHSEGFKRISEVAFNQLQEEVAKYM